MGFLTKALILIFSRDGISSTVLNPFLPPTTSSSLPLLRFKARACMSEFYIAYYFFNYSKNTHYYRFSSVAPLYADIALLAPCFLFPQCTCFKDLTTACCCCCCFPSPTVSRSLPLQRSFSFFFTTLFYVLLRSFTLNGSSSSQYHQIS
jgi:hypothetical protein